MSHFHSKLHRLVFSLRHSKEEREDLDQEEVNKIPQGKSEESGNAGKSHGREIQMEFPEHLHESISSFFSTSTAGEVEEKSGMCHLVSRLCGGGGSPKVQDQEQPEEQEQLPDISEDPKWKYAVNANALIMMAVAFFMWGYYA